MLVKELVLAKPTFCLVDDYLQQTAQIMADNDLMCVPVVESLAHKNVIGVITDKEICRGVVAAGLKPSNTSVGRVMNSRFFTVDLDTDTENCSRIMKENKISFLFVIDENNSCTGIITEDDIAETDFSENFQSHSFQYIRHDRIF
ncbi:MAG: CBS domain-containing protein [Pyrinomonadaceae bacterium]